MKTLSNNSRFWKTWNGVQITTVGNMLLNPSKSPLGKGRLLAPSLLRKGLGMVVNRGFSPTALIYTHQNWFSALFLMIALLICGEMHGQDNAYFRVKYISADNVYLEGGQLDGLSVGDKLVIRNADGIIAELEIVHAADHSASCRILQRSRKFFAGSTAILVKKADQNKLDEKSAKENKKDFEKLLRKDTKRRTRRKNRRQRSRISGRASLQLYRVDDLSERNLDFLQPTFRVNLRARRLWNRAYSLRIRTRTRYDQRNRSFNSGVSQNEWRNRVYEVSFSYDEPDARFNYRFGRITTNKLTGVGYVDGLQLQHNFSQNVAVGFLAGTQPDVRDSSPQTSVQKYGVFGFFQRGNYQSNRIEMTLAAAGEYDHSTISREFVFVRTNYSHGGKFSLYQSAEIDLNRGWRKAKAGQSVTFSNVFVNMRYRFSKRISAGWSFDNRKNFWTYRQRSLADSLFDDALRLGMRGNLSMRLPAQVMLQINGGMRSQNDGGASTFSYAGSLYKPNFLLRGFSFRVNGSGFSNDFTNGYTGNVTLAKTVRAGHRVNVGYGRYAYTLQSNNLTQTSEWVRTRVYLLLPARLFFSGQFEYTWGDDLRGRRFNLELGYRF